MESIDNHIKKVTNNKNVSDNIFKNIKYYLYLKYEIPEKIKNKTDDEIINEYKENQIYCTLYILSQLIILAKDKNLSFKLLSIISKIENNENIIIINILCFLFLIIDVLEKIKNDEIAKIMFVIYFSYLRLFIFRKKMST